MGQCARQSYALRLSTHRVATWPVRTITCPHHLFTSPVHTAWSQTEEAVDAVQSRVHATLHFFELLAQRASALEALQGTIFQALMATHAIAQQHAREEEERQLRADQVCQHSTVCGKVRCGTRHVSTPLSAAAVGCAPRCCRPICLPPSACPHPPPGPLPCACWSCLRRPCCASCCVSCCACQ